MEQDLQSLQKQLDQLAGGVGTVGCRAAAVAKDEGRDSAAHGKLYDPGIA